MLLRVIVWLWPLWLWVAARYAAGTLATNTEYWRAAQTAGPLLLALAAAGMWKAGVLPRGSAWLACAGAIVSGGLGVRAEHTRWSSWMATPGADFGTLVANLDYPLLLTSMACFATPLLLMRMLGSKAASTPFGQARWMTLREARKRFAQGSLVVGEAYEPTRKPHLGGRAPLLHVDGSGHLLTVAGSGSGKTVSVAIPNALNWEHGLVVHDPKGEIYRAAADARRKRGRRVVRLDPTDPQSDSFDVLSWLDPSRDTVVEDARAVASWLLPAPLGAGDGKSDYFRQSGINLLELLILHTVCDPDLPSDRRTLQNVRACLVGNMLDATLVRIKTLGPAYAWGAALDRAAAFIRIADDSPGQWSGVLGEADAATGWLGVPSLVKLVAGSTTEALSVRDFIDGNVDVFICIPLKTLESSPQVARAILGALLNAVYEHGRLGNVLPRRTLFLIDEMPRLRRFELLEIARDAGRGLGVTLWSLVQDIGQLKAAYGDAGLTSWMENSQIRQFFGVSDVQTAELLMKTLGNRTVAYSTSGRTTSESGGLLGGMSSGESRSEALIGKPLLSVDEIMQMRTDDTGAADEQIVLARGQPPLRCGLANHYRRKRNS